jgi:hypothetical protein
MTNYSTDEAETAATEIDECLDSIEPNPGDGTFAG